jgi:hypothetical protein
MPNQNADAVIQLVNEVKKAILEAQQRPGVRNIEIAQVDLELKTTLTKEIDAGGQITISLLPVPIELSGKLAEVSMQTITLSLEPEPALELMGTVSDELADAIEVIAKGAEAAASSQPIFSLKEATASLNVGSTKEGKIVVFVGPGVQLDTAHTIKLTLKRR